MAPSTRREMLGRLGGLLAGLVWFLMPGVLRAAGRATEPGPATTPTRRSAPSARPPQNAVRRNG